MIFVLQEAYYFWPSDSDRKWDFENRWDELTRLSGGKVTSETIPVMFGRYSSF